MIETILLNLINQVTIILKEINIIFVVIRINIAQNLKFLKCESLILMHNPVLDVQHSENSLKIPGMTNSFTKLLLQMKNGSTSAILTKEINGWVLTKWLNQFRKGNGSKKGTIVRLVEF